MSGIESKMDLLYFCILLFCIFFVSQGVTNSTVAVTRSDRNKRLIGGRNTTISAHPYFVSLELDNIPECGGAIVTNYYVLTAAHCLGSDITGWYIRAGSHLTGRGGSIHPVEKFDPHPNFYRDPLMGNVNDIGAIRVKVPIRFDVVRQPIRLYGAGEWIRPRSWAVIVGLGITQSSVQPNQLQKINVPAFNRTQCREYYKSIGEAPAPGTFCTGYKRGGVDACVGDSGGPVVISNRLAGIVSFGIGCGLPRLPGINTQIASFRKWIDRHVEFRRSSRNYG